MTMFNVNSNIEAYNIRVINNNTIKYSSAIFNKPVKYDLRPDAKIIETEGNDELSPLSRELEPEVRYQIGYEFITFNNEVSILDINRSVKEVLFVDCHFESTLTIDMDSDRQDSVTMYRFTNCTFANTVIIQNIHITNRANNSDFTFEWCTFENYVCLDSCKILIIHSETNSTVTASTNLSIRNSDIAKLILKPITSGTHQYKVKILNATITDISTPSSEICNPKQVNESDCLYAIVGGSLSGIVTRGYNKCCLYNVKIGNKINIVYDNLIDIYADSCIFVDNTIFHNWKFENVKLN